MSSTGMVAEKTEDEWVSEFVAFQKQHSGTTTITVNGKSINMYVAQALAYKMVHDSCTTTHELLVQQNLSKKGFYTEALKASGLVQDDPRRQASRIARNVDNVTLLAPAS